MTVGHTETQRAKKLKKSKKMVVMINVAFIINVPGQSGQVTSKYRVEYMASAVKI